MVTKLEFFDKLDRFSMTTCAKGMAPAGIRMKMAENFGLDPEEYRIWIVGEKSVDEHFPMKTDNLFVQKYRSFTKAEKDLDKFRKWFAEWKNENS